MHGTRPMPQTQREVLTRAAAHPMGRVPDRSTVHPGTWSALRDRMFIAGPDCMECITTAGRRALASGRTIPVYNIWQMRWALVDEHTCTDRRTRATVRRVGPCWRLEPNELFPSGLPLGADLMASLRLATEEITNARKALSARVREVTL